IHRVVAEWPFDPQTPFPDCRKVSAACERDDLRPGLGEPATEGPTNPAGGHNCDPHCSVSSHSDPVPSVEGRPLFCGVVARQQVGMAGGGREPGGECFRVLRRAVERHGLLRAIKLKNYGAANGTIALEHAHVPPRTMERPP